MNARPPTVIILALLVVLSSGSIVFLVGAQTYEAEASERLTDPHEPNDQLETAARVEPEVQINGTLGVNDVD